ncbi:MAG: tRNA dihydrouridine synthase DusB [Candidatus Omnitrophota bacterium]
MIKIGKLNLRKRFILAPMAGISDLPFRMLNRGFGAELAFAEMVNARSLSYGNVKSLALLSSTSKDRPLGIQIVGNEVEYIHKAIEKLHKYKFDVLDFNAACPERKVVAKGEGAALLKDPRKLKRLLKILVENSKWPVTVKIRAGWDKTSVNARDVALYAEDAGVSALFIHGRTRNQGYSGEVDYDAIRQVKAALKIPVIGSGDVFSGALAKKMFDETACDAVLVARGALGNPWIFKELPSFLEEGVELERPRADEVIKIMTKHFNSCVRFFGAKKSVFIFRKFFSWYTKGLSDVRVLRVKACAASTKSEMTAVINEIGQSR